MLDLVAIGRISVDLYGQEAGAGLEDPQTFAKAVGGSPTNVAVGTARYGHRAAVLTAVGDDALGRFARRELERYGVDTSLVLTRAGRTPIVVAGTREPDAPELVFYREPDAPDTCITLDDLGSAASDAIRAARIFWISGSALAREPLAQTVRSLLTTRLSGQRSGVALLDLDYRPALWSTPAAARAAMQAILPCCTGAVGNLEECAVATGLPATTPPAALARALHDLGPRLAIVKGGPGGVLVSERAAPTAGNPQAPPSYEAHTVAGIRVATRCGLGAGDAFGAAVVHGLLEDWTIARAVRFANAAGAIVASRLLCSEAMPTAAEVEALLEAHA